jgi:hypothetical protein
MPKPSHRARFLWWRHLDLWPYQRSSVECQDFCVISMRHIVRIIQRNVFMCMCYMCIHTYFYILHTHQSRINAHMYEHVCTRAKTRMHARQAIPHTTLLGYINIYCTHNSGPWYHTYIHTYIHIYIYIYIYIYAHTQIYHYAITCMYTNRPTCKYGHITHTFLQQRTCKYEHVTRTCNF